MTPSKLTKKPLPSSSKPKPPKSTPTSLLPGHHTLSELVDFTLISLRQANQSGRQSQFQLWEKIYWSLQIKQNKGVKNLKRVISFTAASYKCKTMTQAHMKCGPKTVTSH
ncbi:hypothetical protein AMTR_s00030p00169600 [Amborella trichopoda]|uniref:Uncharacterized protein n=1 Tax=Amborella trichopoda TaxID=13333 RepID=U5D1J8_AMBTC|nr:hypothetical protein AMTR_s00030p00169600 [Amborella trichopoda]